MPRKLISEKTDDSAFAVTEVELIYRNKIPAKNRQKIKCSDDAYQIFKNSWDENKIELVEQTKMLLLDKSHSVLGICELFTGGITDCTLDSRIIFATALKAKATAIILAHNHPSGSTIPSDADLKVMKTICAAGQILRIDVLDMFILIKDDYRSFVDDRLVPI